jgi:S-adenosylmethionine:tRNA ribosyltransferase-isomerase
MKISDFDYELPEELIAQYPAGKRDESRMLMLDRSRSEVRETRFASFPRYLREGDMVVVNDSRVIPARLLGKKDSSSERGVSEGDTGADVEVFLVRRTGRGTWRALCRPSRRLRPGTKILFGEAGYAIEVLEDLGGGEWIVSMPGTAGEAAFIEKFGHIPLPPYIRRGDEDLDRKRYQTVYARNDGSVAAPTAGLHFTEEVLGELRRKGITVMPVTLHVGPGTFRPLELDTVEDNVLSSERVIIRKDYLDEILSARSSGRNIVAVGTTVTRALEAAASGAIEDAETAVIDGEEYLTGSTDLFIYPGFEFRVVGSLLTNMHLPRSSLLVLVSAFAGRERVLEAYRWAVERRFRFYSYGDVMFIR